MQQVITVAGAMDLPRLKHHYISDFVDNLSMVENKIAWQGETDELIYERSYSAIGVCAYARSGHYNDHAWLTGQALHTVMTTEPDALLQPLDDLTVGAARRINMYEVEMMKSNDVYHSIGDLTPNDSRFYIQELNRDSSIVTMMGYITEHRALCKIREMRMNLAEAYPDNYRLLSEPTKVGELLLRPALYEPW